MIFKLNSEGFILDWDRATLEEKDDIINEDDVNLSVSIANDLFGDSLLEVK